VTFSARLPTERSSNRLTRAVQQARAEARPILDLTESNPTHAGFEYPSDLLASLADARGLVYEPCPLGLLDARQAIARDYARRGMSVAVDRIVLTASTSEAYSVLFKLLADAGDEVLVPRPSYPLFDHLTRLDLVTAKPYDLEYHGSWSIDISSVERAMTSRTRALLLVSPNNPTGSFVAPRELDQLAALCAGGGVAIIADEVFADYELRIGAAAGAGRVVDCQSVLAFSLGGLSKSVGLPQVKLAWIAAGGPDAIVAEALERLEIVCDTYLSVSTAVQLATSHLLERAHAIRSQIQTRIAGNHRQLVERVATMPACGVLPADGGWYGVVQVPSFTSEEELVVDLVTKAGVLAHPGFFFDFPNESYLVVSLLTPHTVFAEGLDRVLRHLRTVSPGDD
jgi:aspartate/methionine/tyrosine aminotransferase